MPWIQDLFAPEQRVWEDFYRSRWSYDKIVRSTHGVNCTGGCSWNVYVKNGIITWEMQALDYPIIDTAIPPYEPRGCQRGICYSWYIYSPLRVKYPYMRGALMDLWRAAKHEHPDDPVAAWAAVVGDADSRRRYQQARGKGGFRRSSWDEVNELIAAANIHTLRTYGPDRLVGFSPIPAMSMVSYAAGTRFLQLMGGTVLSFYDWYSDLPPASPEVFGEQTDVGESADWFHAKFIAVMGSNVLMTRTPDAHFLIEARHHGAKVVVCSPDFSQTAKVADEWIPLHQGQDGAFWMAVSHVIMREFYLERQVPYFQRYLRQYTDAPFVAVLEKQANGSYLAGPLLRASQVAATQEVENAEWKMFMWDEASGELRMPRGTAGHRWQHQPGEWNLKLEDALSGATIDPQLQLTTFDAVLPVDFADFSEGTREKTVTRQVPVRQIETVNGPVYVTTVFELMLAQHGVAHGEAANYADEEMPYTPAWQQKFTGINAAVVIDFAREWARTAELSNGKCCIIIGTGVNQWYHNNLIYRAAISALLLCGCCGVSGGGFNHYVGQEKLAPQAPWASIAFAADWGVPSRLQNAPSFHYVHSDQWRYERSFNELCPVADAKHPMAHGHTVDKQIMAVRNGWMPCYPQFNRSTFELLREAEAHGAESDAALIHYVVEQLRARKLKFSMEDPDAPECFPRVWYIWRGNALMASAKGHEYFLKHYLGTHNNSVAEEVAMDEVEEITWHDKVELGKMDLVVDLNFRMDTSALYSDIVLPTATHYEKNDLNTTDLHSFIHPMQAAVPPCWEARSDWDIFKEIARQTAQLAETHLPTPMKDLVTSPLMHDTPAEIAQPSMKDWLRGECEALPGKTMPGMKVVLRDYPNIYNHFITLGSSFRINGLSMHGTHYDVEDAYDEYLQHAPVEQLGQTAFPSLRNDVDVCNAILAFAAETNGEMAFRAYAAESVKTGIDHTHIARDTRAVRTTFADICAQPRRLLTTPFWTGYTTGTRTYAGFCQNVEELIPWRTLTGRQHLYLDHEVYRAFGEHLPTFKPRLDAHFTGDLETSKQEGRLLVLNFLTPHGKWQIHSTYSDTLIMRTLSRGIDPIWINDKDAELAGIVDNDWVEVYNDHGVVCTRAIVSARIPRGVSLIYHATERTISVPRSPERGNRRAGGHNSLTRVRLKPLLMLGGYGQFTYAFNYWGPTGVTRDTYIVVRKLEKPNW